MFPPSQEVSTGVRISLARRFGRNEKLLGRSNTILLAASNAVSRRKQSSKMTIVSETNVAVTRRLGLVLWRLNWDLRL
jgi:hypothetical protein